mgnify:CR=1 FL=1
MGNNLTMATLISLPNEILELIMLYLNRKSLMNLSLVSRRFANICNTDSFWKRKIESDYGEVAINMIYKRLWYDFKSRVPFNIHLPLDEMIFELDEDNELQPVSLNKELYDIILNYVLRGISDSIYILDGEGYRFSNNIRTTEISPSSIIDINIYDVDLDRVEYHDGSRYFNKTDEFRIIDDIVYKNIDLRLKEFNNKSVKGENGKVIQFNVNYWNVND